MIFVECLEKDMRIQAEFFLILVLVRGCRRISKLFTLRYFREMCETRL